MNTDIYDIHTHSIKANAVCNISIDKYSPDLPYYFSIGIHPWKAGTATDKELCLIKEYAANKNILAIGETGIDTGCGTSVETQKKLFREHAILAEEVKKPLIIHNVHGTELILKLRKDLKPKVPWIIHGFRGKPQLAEQLTSKGIYLSFGEKYNVETIRSINSSLLLAETDESSMPIQIIYEKIAKDKGWNIDKATNVITNNISNIFTLDKILNTIPQKTTHK